ncbi:ECF RNA polymerase sigma factor SigX [Halolactibacillus alkaliphilus]|uniref:RNA polymerase sigma factor n=1 Tax=Halolactibacillus alkaliphilus TaxID=442899 RepID=A0A511X181_9BACI|nr:sigma-70 family RNA polymerase sigma factor [Halolactibacillus alkaliphilus]GEN56708.1 ECF RNA polymerase sigma factor SigX [Halolactibacillus alkaliphilus]GGN70041.1 ECF RNA polymerase sigma factor SigX [Halolactibacillus alkaliphilus]SFO78022.1 RNA polymerase sigma-70 factor, ECF subfamily [Halolactibacillus alkaliphilus]
MKTTFDYLYDTYHQDVYQYIFYLVKNHQAAEDLIQETYIKVLKSHQHFRGESSEKTWLFSIARHTVMDFFRKQQREKNKWFGLFNKEDDWLTVQSTAPLPEEILVLSEEQQLLYAQLDKLTLDQKNVIILRFIQAMSIHDTARILEWTESKVKTTQHRAIKKLQQLMGDNEKG